MQKIKGTIEKIKGFLSEIGISIKSAGLLLIAFVSLSLIIFDLNGFDFGIIALVCWIFAFLDLARIKIKDIEIDFMTRKQTITADERKLYVDNYELMEKFFFRFMESNKIDSETLEYISKATRTAYLCLSEKLATQLDEYLKIVERVYILDKKIDKAKKNDQATSDYQIEKDKYLEKLYDINLVELYRPYVKVKEYNNVE